MFEGDYKLVHHLAPPADRQEERQGRADQAAVRPVDAQRLRPAGQAEGPARQRARPRSAAAKNASTERALIGEYRACIDEVLRDAERGERCALAVEIARMPGRDPRLRPRQGAPPEGRARQVAAA